MKIFTSAQIHELDQYTIEHEPVSSIDLMERAARALTHAITEKWDSTTPVIVFAGPGNNGGDALAVARMLAELDYAVSVYLFNVHNHLSVDCLANKKRLLNQKKVVNFTEIILNFDPPQLNSDTLVIDGLFGSGLNKPLTGGFAAMVRYINQSSAQVVAIDIPSGLLCEDNTENIRQNIIHADLTLTIQTKKLSMMMADNQYFLGKLKILDIGLSKEYMDKTETQYRIIEGSDITPLLRQRNNFVHKGNMGHALLIAGSYGMAGAAILSSRSCLRAGVGKVTVHTPRRNYDVMQISVPEAVLQMDRDEVGFSQSVDTNDYEAVGIGPGLGRQESSAIALFDQMRRITCPVVLDADALNILADHRPWLNQLPKDIIMTPHAKEFDRMMGSSTVDSFDRLKKAQSMAERLQCYIILKGHYSALCMPNGEVYFNPTGNSGMATAGSGDVLTGIITGLLARGYNQKEACIIGMYIHGLAGDLAVQDYGKESLIASDIIKYLPEAFKEIGM